jgi:hypothetical protein
MRKLNDEGIFFAIVSVLARVPRVSIPERSFRTRLFIFYTLKYIQYLNNFYYFHNLADAYQIKNQTGLYYLKLQVAEQRKSEFRNQTC